MGRRGFVGAAIALSLGNAGARELRSAVEIGVDSYVQRFSLTDVSLGANFDAPDLGTQISIRDTTEVFSEYRTLVELALLDEDQLNRVDLRARGSLGSERLLGQVMLEARMGSRKTPGRLDVAAAVESRRFRTGSEFRLQSDAVLLDLRMHGSRRVGDSRAGLRLRLRQEDFEQPGEFELDERRADLAATYAHEGGWETTANFEVGGGLRELPDSTEIRHRRIFAQGDLGRQGLRWGLWLRGGIEHRRFDEPRVRSPYWDLILEPSLSRRIGDSWRLALRSAHEFLDYEQDSPIYFDSNVGRVGLELSRNQLGYSFAVEPRWGWFEASSEVDDRYRQPSILARFDWFGGRRIWFSLEEEFGHRDYLSRPGEFDLYSDYWFLRTTLLASVRLRSWLGLDLFLSDEPESHRSEEDDGRLTLFSASLRAAL